MTDLRHVMIEGPVELVTVSSAYDANGLHIYDTFTIRAKTIKVGIHPSSDCKHDCVDCYSGKCGACGKRVGVAITAGAIREIGDLPPILKMPATPEWDRTKDQRMVINEGGYFSPSPDGPWMYYENSQKDGWPLTCIFVGHPDHIQPDCIAEEKS